MAKGFKSGGRQKGSKNKANELVVTSIQRAATAGNARVHAKVLHLKLTPLEVMLANMNWAWNQANDIQRHIIKDSNATPEIKLDAFKEMLRLRVECRATPRRRRPMCIPSWMPWRRRQSRRIQP